MKEWQREEYRTLRGEIDRNSQITTTVFMATVTVTSALIGYGLSSEIGPIFLSPFAIIIPSLFFITSQLESTTRIGTYIMVFLEPVSEGLDWETRWFEIRQKNMLPHIRKYTFSLSGLYGTISIGCVILAVLYWDMEWWIFGAIIAPLTIMVSFGVFYLRRAFTFKFCRSYMDAWTKLKQHENQ